LLERTKKHSNKLEHQGKICTFTCPYKWLQFNYKPNITYNDIETMQIQTQKNNVKYIRYKYM